MAHGVLTIGAAGPAAAPGTVRASQLDLGMGEGLEGPRVISVRAGVIFGVTVSESEHSARPCFSGIQLTVESEGKSDVKYFRASRTSGSTR